MDGRGIKDIHKYGEEMSKNSSLPSQEQQETSELNGSGGRRGKGIRGPGPFVLVGGSNWDKRLRGTFVPVGATNRDKRPPFCPGWCLQPGEKAPVPPLARLAVGPGTKATYCPGAKDCRDKWPGIKTYSVVVMHNQAWHELDGQYENSEDGFPTPFLGQQLDISDADMLGFIAIWKGVVAALALSSKRRLLRCSIL